MTTNKYCDCAQGRWPCTCMPRYNRSKAEQVAEAIAFDAMLNTCDELARKNNANADEFVRRVQSMPELGMPYGTSGIDLYAETAKAIKGRPGYWQRLATDKAKLFALKCAEFDALNARLQVYRGVAVIGWAGFILALLGV